MKSSMKTLATIALAGASTLTACTPQRGLQTEPDYTRASRSYSTPDNVKGARLSHVTNGDSTYKLESVVIAGNHLWPEANLYPEDGEFEKGLFIRNEDYSHIRSDAGKTMMGDSDRVLYVLKPVRNDEGNLATQVTFSPTGKFAVKARVTNYDVSDVQTGIIRETEEDVKFDIKTIKTFGVEWYVPLVNTNQIVPTPADGSAPAALNNYMVMKDDALREEIDRETGMITLTTAPGHIFRATAITLEEYKQRALAAELEETILNDENDNQNNIGRALEVK